MSLKIRTVVTMDTVEFGCRGSGTGRVGQHNFQLLDAALSPLIVFAAVAVIVLAITAVAFNARCPLLHA